MFSDIYQNTGLTSALENEIKSGTLNHAYIIEGVPGSGKHTLLCGILCALAETSVKNTSGRQNMNLFGQDEDDEKIRNRLTPEAAAKKIRENLTPDVITVSCEDGRKTIGISGIRAMKGEAYLSPNELPFKAFVIEQADAMTAEAQNALLKLLEEPPDGVYIFLLCDNSALILPTVKSRAGVLRMQSFSQNDIDRFVSGCDVSHYRSMAAGIKRARELRETDRDAYDTALRMSGSSLGGFFAALKARRNSKDTELCALAQEFVRYALEKNETELCSTASRISHSRDEMADFIEYAMTALRDYAAMKFVDGRSAVQTLLIPRSPGTEDLAQNSGAARIMKIFSALDYADVQIRRNVNVYTAAVCMIEKICG